jgi:hypothetical protein
MERTLKKTSLKMKYILAVLVGVLPYLAFAQLYVNGENINEHYCSKRYADRWPEWGSIL